MFLGEKRGIFSSRMPASIERSIREENLRFMQNRDVFSEDYYSFLYEVTMDLLQELCVSLVVELVFQIDYIPFPADQRQQRPSESEP